MAPMKFLLKTNCFFKEIFSKKFYLQDICIFIFNWAFEQFYGIPILSLG